MSTGTSVGADRRPRPGTPDVESIEMGLLRGFRLTCRGAQVDLPLAAQRVLALIALHARPMLRVVVSCTLWPDTTEQRANANLRSALWRLKQPGLTLVVARVTTLSLDPAVHVDVHRAEELGHAILDGEVHRERLGRTALALTGDLLPDWPDDWVVIERERFRQLRLHALEALCEQLTKAGHFGQAVDAGLAAVAGEPLRESAHRAVIKAYLAEGNRCEAVRQFERYRTIAHAEMHVAPSAGMRALLAARLPVDVGGL
jgi:DNA-binding SARP family transcriptional activator